MKYHLCSSIQDKKITFLIHAEMTLVGCECEETDILSALHAVDIRVFLLDAFLKVLRSLLD